MNKLRELVLRIAGKLSWLGPLFARIAVGCVFVRAGWGHLHDIDTMVERFTQWGIPAPHFNVLLSSLTEVIGGSLVILGLGTRVVCVPLIINMIVALSTALRPKIEGILDVFDQSECTYIAVFLWLAVAGPGPISLDHVLGKWLDKKATSSSSPSRPSTQAG